MTATELRQLPADRAAELPPLLHALWHDAHGNWSAAHAIAQDDHTPNGSRVHAYLHHKEGDLSNAGYWYHRAGDRPFPGSVEAHWTAVVTALLDA